MFSEIFVFQRSKIINSRSYSVSNTNDLNNGQKISTNLRHELKNRSTPYLTNISCNCAEANESFAFPSSSCALGAPTSTWNSRIVRKLNSVAHRFNARPYACLISPDRTKLLITPDYEDKHSYSHQTHEVTVIFDIKTYAILRITPARMLNQLNEHEKLVYAFFLFYSHRLRSTIFI